MAGGIVAFTALTNQSCSSEGFRLPETQEECEDIATRLRKSDRVSEKYDNYTCTDKHNYKCSYNSTLASHNETGLRWNPRCDDHRVEKALDDPWKDVLQNLCIQSGN